MTTYYIDYNTGLDSNNGTSTGTPWKHCPGDTNFTGSHTTIAGDTFIFKGGVVYRGSITVSASGTSNNVITYDGNSLGTWGTGKAIIDGSDIWSPTWTQCTSAAECGGNANYSNIWWATAPTGFSILQPLYEDGEFVWWSQSPFPSDPIFFDAYEDFREIPLSDPNKSISTTTIKDTSFFTQSDSNYWVGSYALVWATPNMVYISQITGYNPSTSTITFGDIGSPVYTDRSSWYAVFGHAGIISSVRQIGLYNGSLFIWTKNSDNPNNHAYSYGVRKYGFNLSNCSYILIKNFEIKGYWSGLTDFYYGNGIRSVGVTTSYIEISNNTIKYLRSLQRYGAVLIQGGSQLNWTVTNNVIYDCQKNAGIQPLSAGSSVFEGNTIYRVGATGISSQGIINCQIVKNNISQIGGSHANGIAVYQYSNNVLVAHNFVRCGKYYSYTHENSSNIYTIGNVFDGMETFSVFASWGGMSGINYFLNNTIVRAKSNTAIFSTSLSTDHFYNNVIDGGVSTYSDYNLYTGVVWNQTPQYNWYPATGEIVNTDTTSIFSNYTNGDFTLKSTSPAVNSGTDVSQYYPTTLFPDYDFTKDINGTTRTQWDIGALNYSIEQIQPQYFLGVKCSNKYLVLKQIV